jgi:hypothetical protein
MGSKAEKQDCGPSTPGFMLKSVAKSAADLNRGLPVTRNEEPETEAMVFLLYRRPSGTRDQFFFLLEISFRQLQVYYFVAHSLTRGRVCNLLYNCFWSLPDQSLLGRSPAELTDIFYFII